MSSEYVFFDAYNRLVQEFILNPLHIFCLLHHLHSLLGSCLEIVTDVKEMKSYVFLNDVRERLHGGIL